MTSEFLAQLAAAEGSLAKLIAERALAHPDPDGVKSLRLLWRIANARANYFAEMAALKEADHD